MAKKLKRSKAPEEEAKEPEAVTQLEEAVEEPPKKKKKKVKTVAPPTTEDAEDAPSKETSKSESAPAEKTENSSDPACDPSERTVWISGLPYDWSVQKIEELLREHKFGSFTDIRAPTWQDTGRLRGYCHVEFSTKSKAEECQKKLDQYTLPNSRRWLDVKMASSSQATSGSAGGQNNKLGKNCKRVFVKNLPYSADEKEIAALFEPFGTLLSVRIGNENGRSKGFCYVEFEDRKAAIASLQDRDSYKLQGRKLIVDADTGSGPKAGFHYRKEAWESGYAVKDKKKAPW